MYNKGCFQCLQLCPLWRPPLWSPPASFRLICAVSCTEKKARYLHSSGQYTDYLDCTLNAQPTTSFSLLYCRNTFVLAICFHSLSKVKLNLHFDNTLVILRAFGFLYLIFTLLAPSILLMWVFNFFIFFYFYLPGCNFWRVLPFAPWFMDNLNLCDDHAPHLLFGVVSIPNLAPQNPPDAFQSPSAAEAPHHGDRHPGVGI